MNKKARKKIYQVAESLGVTISSIKENKGHHRIGVALHDGRREYIVGGSTQARAESPAHFFRQNLKKAIAGTLSHQYAA